MELAGRGRLDRDRPRAPATRPASPPARTARAPAARCSSSPRTWARYGVDGNGDGLVSRYDARDAIPAAARYLHASGAPADWGRALFAYNHAGWYVADVARRAAGYRGAAHADPNALPTGGQRVADAEHAEPADPAAGADRRHARRSSGAPARELADRQRRRPRRPDRDRRARRRRRRDRARSGADSVTLRTRSNRFFYEGLRRVGVHDGERVSAGQTIGSSGTVNGAEQLHIAVEHGDPTALWGNGAPDAQSAPLGGCDTGVTGPASLGQAQTVQAPRAFATLPAWAMAGARAPAEIDARILPDALWILRTYALRVTAGRETGHLSHGDGTALDLVPADPAAGQAAWDASALRLARDIGWTTAARPAASHPCARSKDGSGSSVTTATPTMATPPTSAPTRTCTSPGWPPPRRPGALAPPNAWVRVFPVPAAPQDGT